jgi:hypothetical protein
MTRPATENTLKTAGNGKIIENAESALMCDSATPLFSVTVLFYYRQLLIIKIQT